jgi:hypothetical protein
MLYVGGLLVMRTRMQDYPGATLPWYLHMVWVHAAAAVMVAGVYVWPRLRGRRTG